MMSESVRAWSEKISIPTYRVGAPNRNPMFLERRVYQGSSGAVYPLAVIDQVYDEKEDREYTALFLENRYLRVMILPEIGGRVHMALDKTNGYHFVYHNRVIKPALVGLAGPWIAGGIEFNWPQHHRPTTFSPVDWRIVDNADGSCTIWCAEIEPMFFTKGTHGFTLHPDRAVLQVDVQLYNRTDMPQTFLWWANPAVAVGDGYQSVFPPDVTVVMDHGKRDLATFPIATGVYYKHDYAPGTDISRYRNIPVPTSYMAYHSEFDFVGGYDHHRHAGMMHVSEHRTAPGKKQWTWGNGAFGKAWERHLTDEDGPYIELMCGAYTDNQPDFSWLQPGEEKRFTQYFFPYKQIGPPHNASVDAALRLVRTQRGVEIGVYLTSARAVQLRLLAGNRTLLDALHDLSPETPLLQQIDLPADTHAVPLCLQLWAEGRLLLASSTEVPASDLIPPVATAAPDPADIASNEELYLHGLHLEQYRHATFAPEPYYQEALRRDPLDARCNNALGLLFYRRGDMARAEEHFRRAIKRLTMRNPNPYDGEPYYNLGLTLHAQGRFADAYDAFYKAVWNHAWQAAGYFALARLASREGDWSKAHEHLDRVLALNGLHHKARHLRIAVLRHQGCKEQAAAEIDAALALDALEYGALHEGGLLGRELPAIAARADGNTVLELAIDYAHAGLYSDAVHVLDMHGEPTPAALYLRGWVQEQAGDVEAAGDSYRQARAVTMHHWFPHRLEEYWALQSASTMYPDDARAAHALGDFLYAHRRHDEAVAQWARACALDPADATAHRNLGLGLYSQGRVEEALASYARAFALDASDARVLFEYDQLCRRANHSPQSRRARLAAHLDLVTQRDDLSMEYAMLLNLLGEAEAARAWLYARTFHPWEGGEGKVSAQYVQARIALARRALAAGEAAAAIALLEEARQRPTHLGEAKLEGSAENDVLYWLGTAWRMAGNAEAAAACFASASQGSTEPTMALAYYDQPPEMILYRALSLGEIGNSVRARAVLQNLLDYGLQHLDDRVRVDYFAVSMPEFALFEEPIERRHRIHCHYMAGLGALGLSMLGQETVSLAQHHLGEVLKLDASHQGALIHLQETGMTERAQ